MKASICIPLFNASPWIAQTLRSVIRQASKGDEIILVDDHSTDDSASKARTILEASDVSFKLAQNQKKGACAARNQALKMSSGELIQWLDADDFLGDRKVERAKTHLKQFPNQILACPWHPFEDNIHTGLRTDDVNWKVVPDFSSPSDWLARDTFMGLHCYAGHRSLFEKAGPWDESLTINQDGEYFARVIAQSSGVHFTMESDVYYRRSSSGSVSRFTPKKADSLFRSIESMAKTALQTEESQRMEQMIANRWQHFIFTVYPSRQDLLKKAQDKLKYLPRPTISNPNAVSKVSKLTSKYLGWKTLTRARLLREKYRPS